MKQLKLTVLFLVVNFSGLAIGSWLMNNGPLSDWYTDLNQAPWTPPGYVFGIAWTLIMICFSIYLGKLFTESNWKNKLSIFLFQFTLNVCCNFIFFYQHLFFLLYTSPFPLYLLKFLMPFSSCF